MTEPFLTLAEIAPDFKRTTEHLRKIAEAQHGLFSKPRFSNRALGSYPRFQRGPGGKWGIFKGAYDRYWSDLKQQPQNVVDAASRFRRRA